MKAAAYVLVVIAGGPLLVLATVLILDASGLDTTSFPGVGYVFLLVAPPLALAAGLGRWMHRTVGEVVLAFILTMVVTVVAAVVLVAIGLSNADLN